MEEKKLKGGYGEGALQAERERNFEEKKNGGAPFGELQATKRGEIFQREEEGVR